MKLIILVLFAISFISSVHAFRGGGGFRGGGVSVGVGVGSSGAVGSRGNVSVGVGVSGSRGSVSAHRSAAMSANYHAYSSSYWGWYGYAPYHYYYPTSTYSEVEVKDTEPAEVGTVVNGLPDNCESETIKGINYKHCGVNWFEPQYSGTEIEYVIVRPPTE